MRQVRSLVIRPMAGLHHVHVLQRTRSLAMMEAAATDGAREKTIRILETQVCGILYTKSVLPDPASGF